MMVQQNKWRAARYGNEATLIESFTYKGQSTTQAVDHLVERLMPTADSLQCVNFLEHARKMAAGPNWSTRQVEILEKTGDPREVVRQLVQQSRLSNQEFAS